MSVVNVLFVEDDEDDYILTLDLINDITFEKFNVTRAKNAQIALELLKGSHIDLCFLDYQLGAVNGIELLKQARSLGFNAPVIMLTGQESHSLDETALAAGADDYLVKSELTVARLSRAMRYALARRDIAHERVERLKAEADNKLKNQFLAHLSHELRTPLTAILGYTELLIHTQSHSHLDEELSIILRNSQHLLELLNDVLDLSKIEANKLEVFLSNVHLSVMLTDIYTLMNHVAQRKGLTLTLQSDAVPEYIHTDPTRFKQIVMNLINNAIKFTDVGSVTIKISLCEHVLNCLKIDVIDTGIGIADENLSKIFQPFEQVADVVSKRVGGSGMGLAISYKLAKLLNGDIQATSQLGVGSNFSFTVNVGETAKQMLHPVAITNKPKESNTAPLPVCNGRVLVVDDIDDIRKLIGLLVKKTGAKVQCVENGRQALFNIEQSYQQNIPYDLVLMDIHMPEVSGDKAITFINKRYPDLNVVAITAATMKGTKAKLMELGFSDVISKPVDQSEIYTLLSQTLPQKNQQEKPQFLLVEDNIDAANALKMLLSTQDVGVTVAHTKTEAEELIRNHTYQCLLTDINLPDGSGFDIITTIKHETPLCFIAVASGEDISENSMSHKIHTILQKPINLAALKELVSNVKGIR